MSDDAGGLRPHLSYGSTVKLMIPEEELELAYSVLNSEKPEVIEQMREESAKEEVGLDSEGVVFLNKAWKLALMGMFLIPIIGNLYSLYLLKTAHPLLVKEEWEGNSKNKFSWAIGLNFIALYFYYELLKDGLSL